MLRTRRGRQGRGAATAPVADNGPVESQVTAGPREVVILGSTGSIGTQALDIIRRNTGRFRVVALAAGGGNPDLLARQAAEFGVAAVAVADPAARPAVQAALRDHFSRTDSGIPAASPRAPASPAHPGITPAPPHHPAGRPEVLAGPDAVCEVARWPCDVVLNGVTGAAGLQRSEER